MDDSKLLLGRRLREARKRKGISQTRVAIALGVHNSTITKYESGEREPDAENLRRLAELYEVSVDWLTGMTNGMVKESPYDYKTDPDVTPKLKELLDMLYSFPPEEQLDIIEQARTYIAGKKALNRSSDS